MVDKVRRFLLYSDSKFVHAIFICVFKLYEFMHMVISFFVYIFCRFKPLKNRIVATAFNGKKYGDNTQFVVEELHKLNPDYEIVWLKDEKLNYDVPSYVTVVPANSMVKKLTAIYTSKVWISTHRLDYYVIKRKGQLFIETWHGGLGIKKIDGDVAKYRKDIQIMDEVKNTAKKADLFISNSKHLTDIYRRAFDYKGLVWKSGYPKNDSLFQDKEAIKDKVKSFYGLKNDDKLLVYAPTFRDDFNKNGVNLSVYDIKPEKVYKALGELSNDNWYVLFRFHPYLLGFPEINDIKGEHLINATAYPDMQELILASDFFVSDYSSCIFDAAMTGIPCFTFATDFEDYKGDRGVYYEMEELPFPYAKTSDELVENICSFDMNKYNEAWKEFERKTGLHETGHAAKDIAEFIDKFMKQGKSVLSVIADDTY